MAQHINGKEQSSKREYSGVYTQGRIRWFTGVIRYIFLTLNTKGVGIDRVIGEIALFLGEDSTHLLTIRFLYILFFIMRDDL